MDVPDALLLLPAGADVPGLTALIHPPFTLRAMPTDPQALGEMVGRIGTREEQTRSYTHLFALHGPSAPPETYRDAFFTLTDQIEQHSPHAILCTLSGERTLR
ncbi:hypothetical protein ACMT4L_01305 [Deinococcus sp. A31D244]|uniref:hypothetical protein n=1 Tax=Deinococcus sp. A31D244 TaxID=3397675 RepID=UPI0039DFAD45